MKGITSERFWSNIEVLPCGCWKWTGSTRGGSGGKSTRYGQYYEDGKSHYAHRVAYELANGSIDPNLEVLHSCDFRLCVNPKHLSQGTPQENSKDMVSKGHVTRGEKSHNAKILDRDVWRICYSFSRGLVTVDEISRIYNLSHKNVYKLLHGQNYTHIPRPTIPVRPKRKHSKSWVNSA